MTSHAIVCPKVTADRYSYFSSIIAMSDPTTQSNYLNIASENISFDWKLDFEKQTISGTATHTLRANEDGVQDVM